MAPPAKMDKGPKKKPTGKKTPPTTKKEVLLFGATGRMGLEISELLKNHPTFRLGAAVTLTEITAYDDLHMAVLKNTPKALAGVLQGADVIIDFSSPSGTASLLKSVTAAKNKTILIGTTGLPEKLQTEIRAVAKAGAHKILMAGNTSLGVSTLAKLAVMAAKNLAAIGFDIEITETHHHLKTDTPSGTAIFFAEMIQKTIPGSKIVFNGSGKRVPGSIGIHSIRGGGVIGDHDIRFISESEEICLSHRALNRSLFAKGALNLVAEITSNLKPGTAMALRDYILA
jgi:4-hydroxy-tetrahydrodipicolinate reductase